MGKTVSEAIKYRRSVRKYLDTNLNEEKVKNCIKNATLAPNSSNMQLWEFYHITDKKVLSQLSKACFCLLYTSPSPRDATLSRMPSSA